MSISASSPPRWKYDVFLSFRGDDTRKTFTDHLYSALEHRGIIAFRDEPQLQKGKPISPELFSAIEESRFALVVLSQNYASSTWCLDELARILECMKATETVLPIFYNVDPSDVRKQTGSFREAFTKHEERFGDDKEKLQRWRSAFTQVASFSGWNSKEWYEAKLIKDIVEVIWKKLQPTLFHSVENLVGIDSRLQSINLLLGAGVDDVRFIGIWGMGGIGKTTMVRVVYERISREFELSFLLTNVRNSVEKSGLLDLQKQLLSGIWTKKDDIIDISDLHEGATIIKRLFGHKKVLLILDDVNHPSHLKYLAGNQQWFGPGSRVLITTRNEHLLIQHRVERILKAEELSYDDSLQLFSLKAFESGCPEKDFLGMSKSVVNYAQGLPLALEVLGSFLHGRGLNGWNSALRKLGRVCNPEIFDILKISYDELDYEEKKIFLDIACFFNGEDKDRVTEVLTSCDVSAIIGIEVLMERSLLTLSYGRLWMHDLLREMGCEIVRQESLDEPGKRSRLWLPEDINYVLRKNTGTEAIEGIFVDSTKSGVEVDVNAKSFSMMSKLRYLKINCGNLPNGLECLPNCLRILNWTGYPSKSLPQHFNPEKLLELSLCHSCFEHFHPGMETFYNLKTINLGHCVNLLSTPNFRVMPYLELLILEGCTQLYKIDPSIEVLSRLVVLNLKDCKNLVHFASSLCGLKSLEVLDLSGCSKVNKLPNDMDHLESLKEFYVNGTGIRELPSLKNLKELSLHGCKGQSPKSWNMIFNRLQLVLKTSYIPEGLSGLHSLTKLDLSDSDLLAFPSDVGCLSSLRELNLSRNQFVELPWSICQLSKLRSLNLDGCRKLRTLSGLPSHVWLNVSNCISLDTLPNSNLVLSTAKCFNCFKMVGNERFKSIALSLLTRYLQEPKAYHKGYPSVQEPHPKRYPSALDPHPKAYPKGYRGYDRFEFVAPGNEIPKWYKHQSEGCSIIVELHPGWFSNKWMGFALCAVFRLLKPFQPPLCEMDICCSLRANGIEVTSSSPFLRLGEKWGQPVLDHIWLFYLPRDRYFPNRWQDIYYQLEFSFKPNKMTLYDGVVEVNKCGVRMIYEEDAEELRQTFHNVPINTKPGLQHCDLFDVLQSTLWEDVMHGSESWTVFHVEISEAVLDVERLIFKDLIDEIVIGEQEPVVIGEQEPVIIGEQEPVLISDQEPALCSCPLNFFKCLIYSLKKMICLKNIVGSDG